jgi:hypothetical protein
MGAIIAHLRPHRKVPAASAGSPLGYQGERGNTRADEAKKKAFVLSYEGLFLLLAEREGFEPSIEF